MPEQWQDKRRRREQEREAFERHMESLVLGDPFLGEEALAANEFWQEVEDFRARRRPPKPGRKRGSRGRRLSRGLDDPVVVEDPLWADLQREDRRAWQERKEAQTSRVKKVQEWTELATSIFGLIFILWLTTSAFTGARAEATVASATTDPNTTTPTPTASANSGTTAEWQKGGAVPEVDMLPRGSLRKGRSVGINNRELEFMALDCSTPMNVTSTTVDRKLACKDPPEPIREERKIVRLLQLADKTRFQMVRCRARSYQLVYVCNYATGHSTLVGNEWAFDKQWVMKADDCRRACKEGRYMGQPTEQNTTSHLYVTSQGHDWATGKDLHCEGAPWYWFKRQQHHEAEKRGGITGVPSNMVKEHVNLEMHVFEGTVDREGQLMDMANQVVLPCRLEEERCTVLNHGTYVWSAPPEVDRCPLYSTRPDPIKGSYLTDDDGHTTFLTTDSAMLRLELKETISMCAAQVTRTGYSNLFLTEETNYAPFKRTLHESEVSLATYSNAKDEYLQKDIIGKFVEGINELRKEQCEKGRKQRSADYARRA